MANTTIAIPNDMKQEIMEFGSKGETYADILARLIKSAKDRLLYDILLDEKDTVTIEKALSDAKKRWQ